MPRSKTYINPRISLTIRIDERVHSYASETFKERGYSSFSDYVEKLINDDLTVAEANKIKQQKLEHYNNSNRD